jgi:hypothetical protein
MIYLASPYSHPDPLVRDARFHATCRAAAHLIRDGHSVFPPIVIGHALVPHGLPPDWTFWEPHVRGQLERASSLAVLTLPGWRESVGVQAEIEIARSLGLPITYVPAPSS